MGKYDLGPVVGPQGPQGATGPQGAAGPQGLPGPNEITGSTATSLNGVLAGNGSTVGAKTVDSAPDASHTGNLITSAAVANQVLRFTGVATGTGGTLCTVSNAAITVDHVVVECVFAAPENITGNVTWTTAAGSLTLTGSASAATSVSITLVRKGN